MSDRQHGSIADAALTSPLVEPESDPRLAGLAEGGRTPTEAGGHPEGVGEVVATEGEGVPPVGTRVPYPGSLTEEIIEHGEPALLAEMTRIGERIAPYL